MWRHLASAEDEPHDAASVVPLDVRSRRAEDEERPGLERGDEKQPEQRAISECPRPAHGVWRLAAVRLLVPGDKAVDGERPRELGGERQRTRHIVRPMKPEVVTEAPDLSTNTGRRVEPVQGGQVGGEPGLQGLGRPAPEQVAVGPEPSQVAERLGEGRVSGRDRSANRGR